MNLRKRAQRVDRTSVASRPSVAGPRCAPAGLLAATLALGSLLLGCQAAGRHAASQPAVPTESNAQLVEYIGDLPFVTAEPAYRAVYILAHGEVFEGDFDALCRQMRSEHLIAPYWHHRPDSYLDRAAVSYMIARAIDLRSGLNWRLFGLGRYAHRELVYRGIAHPASEMRLISGGEFLGMLARAEDYLYQHRPQLQRAELGSAP